MNRSFSIIASVMLALSATSFAQKADYRNFSIAPFYPNSAEIQLAEASPCLTLFAPISVTFSREGPLIPENPSDKYKVDFFDHFTM